MFLSFTLKDKVSFIDKVIGAFTKDSEKFGELKEDLKLNPYATVFLFYLIRRDIYKMLPNYDLVSKTLANIDKFLAI